MWFEDNYHSLTKAVCAEEKMMGICQQLSVPSHYDAQSQMHLQHNISDFYYDTYICLLQPTSFYSIQLHNWPNSGDY